MRKGNRLTPTLAGIDSRMAIGQTWGRVVEHLAGRGAFEQATFEVCALILILANGPVAQKAMVTDAASALGEYGWRTDTPDGQGAAPSIMAVSSAAWEGIRRLELFGVITESGDWHQRHIELTPAGRDLVLAWLRRQAAGPRHDLH